MIELHEFLHDVFVFDTLSLIKVNVLPEPLEPYPNNIVFSPLIVYKSFYLTVNETPPATSNLVS